MTEKKSEKKSGGGIFETKLGPKERNKIVKFEKLLVLHKIFESQGRAVLVAHAARQ